MVSNMTAKGDSLDCEILEVRLNVFIFYTWYKADTIKYLFKKMDG